MGSLAESADPMEREDRKSVTMVPRTRISHLKPSRESQVLSKFIAENRPVGWDNSINEDQQSKV